MADHPTTDQVLADIDLSGTRVLVTGSSGGLGRETSRALAAHGATVLMAARNAEKNEAAAAAIRDGQPDASVEPVELDLSSLDSVSDCADRIGRGDPLDVFIANAGVMACPFGHTADGFETQFGVNHLGHFLLAGRLAPQVSDGGRIVMLSSAAHIRRDVDLDDPNFEHQPYDNWQAYGQSKTANVLHAVELNRRLAPRGVRAVSVHPGAIATDLSRHLTQADLEMLASRRAASGSAMERKSVEHGAATTVWAATTPDFDRDGGGVYCEDCHVAELREADWPPGRGVQPHALHPERAAELWARSEEMVGECFLW